MSRLPRMKQLLQGWLALIAGSRCWLVLGLLQALLLLSLPSVMVTRAVASGRA